MGGRRLGRTKGVFGGPALFCPEIPPSGCKSPSQLLFVLRLLPACAARLRARCLHTTGHGTYRALRDTITTRKTVLIRIACLAVGAIRRRFLLARMSPT